MLGVGWGGLNGIGLRWVGGAVQTRSLHSTRIPLSLNQPKANQPKANPPQSTHRPHINQPKTNPDHKQVPMLASELYYKSKFSSTVLTSLITGARRPPHCVRAALLC